MTEGVAAEQKATVCFLLFSFVLLKCCTKQSKRKTGNKPFLSNECVASIS
jgi:hypothetical protein